MLDGSPIANLIVVIFSGGVVLLAGYLYFNSFVNSGIKGKIFMVIATVIALPNIIDSTDYTGMAFLFAFYPLCLYCIAVGWTRGSK